MQIGYGLDEPSPNLSKIQLSFALIKTLGWTVLIRFYYYYFRLNEKTHKKLDLAGSDDAV